jgi:hypothetical protein
VYNIKVTNTGDITLVGITVMDSLLGDLSSYFAGTLEPLASENHDFIYTVQVSDTSPLVNTVTVHANPTGMTNDITDNASASVTMMTIVHPSIDITKVADPTTVCLVRNLCEDKHHFCDEEHLCEKNLCNDEHLCGEEHNCEDSHQTYCSPVGTVITYTITITNTGDITLENIKVFDSLLGDLSSYFADSLAPLASENHKFTYTIKICDKSPLVNTVIVHSNPHGCCKDITATASASVCWFSRSCRSGKKDCEDGHNNSGTTHHNTKS